MAWYATRKASKLPSLDKSKILVFDTETTGLEPTVDEIIQITILDGYGTALFNSYIRPKHHRSWNVAELSRGTLRAEKTADYFRRLRLQQRAVSEETARLCRK